MPLCACYLLFTNDHLLATIYFSLPLTNKMENFEQRWLDTQMLMQERFGKIPDMEGMLFLIGVNELGRLPRKKFSKEQKQDLMHVAVCTLLSQLGYYEYVGRDEAGWPHFNELAHVTLKGINEQERMLKECIVRYFE